MAKDFKIARIGAEPVVVWERTPENDLPRATVMVPGWRFEGPGGAYLELGPGGTISFTIEMVDYVPLVPSDPEPDIEHGFVWMAGRSPANGWTLAELRAVALADRQLIPGDTRRGKEVRTVKTRLKTWLVKIGMGTASMLVGLLVLADAVLARSSWS